MRFPETKNRNGQEGENWELNEEPKKVNTERYTFNKICIKKAINTTPKTYLC